MTNTNNLIILFFTFFLCNLASGSENISCIKAPYAKDGDRIFFTGDFLYWSSQVDNLQFARSKNTGSTKCIHSSWAPGFRVGVGSILPHDNWEIFFEYTRIQNKNTAHAGSNYYPLWNIAGLLGAYPSSFTTHSSKASKAQTFNDLNITLGRTFIPSRSTLFYPFVGIKGTYDTQHYNVAYEQVSSGGALLKEANLSMKTHQRFWGVGILGGVNSEWLMIKYLSLFGHFYLAGVSSHFNTSRKDFLSYTDSSDHEETLVSTGNNHSTLQAMFDLELGVKTDLWFKEDSYHFSLQAGWEFQTWLHQCQSQNLSFQGLTLKARLDF